MQLPSHSSADQGPDKHYTFTSSRFLVSSSLSSGWILLSAPPLACCSQSLRKQLEHHASLNSALRHPQHPCNVLNLRVLRCPLTKTILSGSSVIKAIDSARIAAEDQE
jgi:hypothetical protein